jgi:putative redox protein
MATQVTIKNIPNGYQSIISNGRHTIVGDEPVSSKGTDLGFSPTELVLAGLAMCKVATVRFIARQKGWDDRLRDVDARLGLEVTRGEGGKLSPQVTVDMQIEGELTDAECDQLLRQADRFYVHRMFEGEWSIMGATLLEPV